MVCDVSHAGPQSQPATLRVARMADDEVEHSFGAEAPAAPEDALDAGVVERGVEPDPLQPASAPLRAEAGERARGLADVALGVAAPEREELHELACVVLVG